MILHISYTLLLLFSLYSTTWKVRLVPASPQRTATSTSCVHSTPQVSTLHARRLFHTVDRRDTHLQALIPVVLPGGYIHVAVVCPRVLGPTRQPRSLHGAFLLRP